MALLGGSAPCERCPTLFVVGTLANWRAGCKVCGTVWRPDDYLGGTPVWVREFVHEQLGAIANAELPPDE